MLSCAVAKLEEALEIIDAAGASLAGIHVENAIHALLKVNSDNGDIIDLSVGRQNKLGK